MFEQFKKYISENDLIKNGDRILMAVSGGIDSMVMAHLLLRTGTETGIAHCNFSLRGEESDLDEELVREYASNHMIPFWSIRFETKEFAVRNGISVQMAARDLRYKWFDEIREKHRFDSIAVAHNLNDNIETMLINLTRGTGLKGLTGMRPSGRGIIRPLLFATRQSIAEYCKENNVIYRDDRSNSETIYARNKIRHLIIPVLREINQSVETTLNETAERFYGINEIVNSYTEEIRKNIFFPVAGNFEIKLASLEPYVGNKTILYELFKPFGITDSLLTDLLNVIGGKTGGHIMTPSHRILKNRKVIIITPDKEAYRPVFEIPGISEMTLVPQVISAQYVNITDEFKIPSGPFIGCFDAGMVSFPLTIRKWEKGDFFFPFGMKSRKKLSDYFIDRKLSIPEKEEIFVMESAGEIAWIMGERIDNRFRITRSTKKALVIVIKPFDQFTSDSGCHELPGQTISGQKEQ
jgi:tRNA(Ile)-lysidine synthase